MVHLTKSKKPAVALCALLVLTACPVYAALPNSGSALEGVKPPAVEQSGPSTPQIRIEQPTPATAGDQQQKLSIAGFRFSGELPLPEQELLPFIQKEGGREFTVSELNDLAGKITQHLHEKGFLVAFAYIPAQTIADGVVEITVVPGKYGEIKVTGEGMSSDRVRHLFASAKPGAVITEAPLERALLLAGELSGLGIKATLAPGAASGTADLILSLSRTDRTTGLFYADNWGNRYSGQLRSGALVMINNPGNNGDQIILGGQLTEDRRMDNYSLGYNTPIGFDGVRLALNHSRVNYSLGGEFVALGAAGQAVTDQVSLSYPLRRSRVITLDASLGYEHKHLQDDITESNTYSRKTSGLWNLGITGSVRDNWLGGGISRFTLTQSWGQLHINDIATAAMDATTANTAGRFSKTLLTLQRQQAVAENLNFTFNFTGQLSNKNLDSSEKLYLGGADGIRAYSQGEGGGDQGYKLTGELRWRLPGLSSGKDNVYLASFYDYGHVSINKQPYSSDDNGCSLAGAGLGLLWTRDRDFVVRLDYAWKTGSRKAEDEKNGRMWLQGVKYF